MSTFHRDTPLPVPQARGLDWQDAAAWAGMDRTTFYRVYWHRPEWHASLGSVKVGRQWRVSREGLETWRAQGMLSPQPHSGPKRIDVATADRLCTLPADVSEARAAAPAGSTVRQRLAARLCAHPPGLWGTFPTEELLELYETGIRTSQTGDRSPETRAILDSLTAELDQRLGLV